VNLDSKLLPVGAYLLLVLQPQTVVTFRDTCCTIHHVGAAKEKIIIISI